MSIIHVASYNDDQVCHVSYVLAKLVRHLQQHRSACNLLSIPY
jgi:hypothetical protein